MNYVSIKTNAMRPNLSNMASCDIKDVKFPTGPESHKSRYYIYFFTGAGERYEWEFETEEARNEAYANLPHTPIDRTK